MLSIIWVIMCTLSVWSGKGTAHAVHLYVSILFISPPNIYMHRTREVPGRKLVPGSWPDWLYFYCFFTLKNFDPYDHYAACRVSLRCTYYVSVW